MMAFKIFIIGECLLLCQWLKIKDIPTYAVLVATEIKAILWVRRVPERAKMVAKIFECLVKRPFGSPGTPGAWNPEP